MNGKVLLHNTVRLVEVLFMVEEVVLFLLYRGGMSSLLRLLPVLFFECLLVIHVTGLFTA